VQQWVGLINENMKVKSWNCCNHSAGVVLKSAVHHKRNAHEEKHHIYVARTSNNRVIAACDLSCCLLSQCEALRTCCLGFPMATEPFMAWSRQVG